MNEDWYLIDANVLTRLTAVQRSSAFVRDRCRIPADVMHEVRGLPDRSAIAHLELPLDAPILLRLRDVMATIDPGDFSLIDLYHNKGTADPVLIAAALALDHGEGRLWPIRWHVVSDDHAVRETASTLGVPRLSRDELLNLIGC
ncbi:hypothetical protein [Cellulomonas denverensis]|uniref:PIN domain-containing protein n=1 Tax=Cellulomonas denverensis TaxID=264297 RepID=A0A7X6QZU9_9CELL|nr:hypothetical protein [Cellulomonas denverensis]NKY23497.1 hypothetical protein [Cellulomonas denverensis]GIG25019.1 hypothetical protein Cde04nite_12630 [Cellulomonas denverensis]